MSAWEVVGYVLGTAICVGCYLPWWPLFFLKKNPEDWLFNKFVSSYEALIRLTEKEKR